jgi:hypothetical protein
LDPFAGAGYKNKIFAIAVYQGYSWILGKNLVLNLVRVVQQMPWQTMWQ